MSLSRLGLADSCLATGDPAGALSHYKLLPRSLRSSPDVAVRLAGCALALMDLDFAIPILRRLLRQNARNAWAGAYLARCYALQGRFVLARTLAEASLEQAPGFSEALIALGMALGGIGDHEATVRIGRELLKVQQTPSAVSHYLYHLVFSSDTSFIESESVRLGALCFGGQARSALPPSSSVPTGPLRIGYVSALFGAHLECLDPLLRYRDPARFEVHVFADPGGGTVRAKEDLSQFCTWHDTGALSNEALAQLVHDNGIHVLVDCDGHFAAGRRLGLYRFRSAPLQLSFLYPHRTGVADLDYQLTDEILTPSDAGSSTPRTSEIPWRLPLFACHVRPPMEPAVAPPPAIKNGYVTFGSFNGPLKLNAEVVETWSEILHRVPRSRLILHGKLGPLNYKPLPDIARRLRSMFASHKIRGNRLRLVGNLDLSSHMDLYGKVDIALDPFPHNGMRTTFMALWMGVPVLTKLGDSMISRMSASLLHAAGLPDWVTPGRSEYVDQACRRAADLPALAALRAGMRNRLASSRLFDGKAFTASLENAILAMWKERQL